MFFNSKFICSSLHRCVNHAYCKLNSLFYIMPLGKSWPSCGYDGAAAPTWENKILIFCLNFSKRVRTRFKFRMRSAAFTERVQTHLTDAFRCIRCFILAAFNAFRSSRLKRVCDAFLSAFKRRKFSHGHTIAYKTIIYWDK